jgi:hypothetical protein
MQWGLRRDFLHPQWLLGCSELVSAAAFSWSSSGGVAAYLLTIADIAIRGFSRRFPLPYSAAEDRLATIYNQAGVTYIVFQDSGFVLWLGVLVAGLASA